MSPEAQEIETLRRVLAAGELVYRDRMWFSTWSRQMIVRNGTYVRPYLRKAWRHLRTGTTPCDNLHRTDDAHSDQRHPTLFYMALENWKPLIIGSCLGVCLILGAQRLGLVRSPQRFMLISPKSGYALKMDITSGKTWVIYLGLEEASEVPVTKSPQTAPQNYKKR